MGLSPGLSDLHQVAAVKAGLLFTPQQLDEASRWPRVRLFA